MRPRRAPAGIVRNSSVRLPGVRPRWRMSSLKEVIVIPFATFGSATNVPAPRRRVRWPSRTSSSSAARTVEPGDAELDARAAARTGSRRRPRASRSARAPARGSRAASSSRSPSARRARLARGGSSRAPVSRIEELEPLRDRPPARAGRRRARPVRASTRAVNSAPPPAISPRASSPGLEHLGRDRPGVDGEEDVRVGAEVLEHLDDDLDRRQARARTRASSKLSGRMPRITAPVGGTRGRARAGR